MGNKTASLVPDTSHDIVEPDINDDETDTITSTLSISTYQSNSLWSLKTLMVLFEGYIRTHAIYESHKTIPVEIMYLCSQFYGFKTLMILLSKLYTYPNMPNGLKFLSNKSNTNWIQFKIHDNHDINTMINIDSDDEDELSTFKYNKELTQSFEYIPAINCRMIPKNIINSTHINPGAIITYDDYIIRGLSFTRQGYKGYDNDTIVDGYEFEFPNIDIIEYKTENQYKIKYSKVHQSLFATVQTKKK
eukprot:173271_1